MGKNKYLYITLLAVLGFQQEAVAQIVASTPRLVVNITIDQLRSDYMETFVPFYTNDGFKRLLSQGRVYAHASYNFAPVDRASAMASIATGTTPYYHGITGEEWFDRQALKTIKCITTDKQEFSPMHLLTTTVGDEMRQTRRKTESVAAVRLRIKAATTGGPCSVTAAVQQCKRISRFAQQDRLGRKRRGVRGDRQLHARDLFEERLQLLGRVLLYRTRLFRNHDRVRRRLSARRDLKRRDASVCKGGAAHACRQEEKRLGLLLHIFHRRRLYHKTPTRGSGKGTAAKIISTLLVISKKPIVSMP